MRVKGLYLDQPRKETVVKRSGLSRHQILQAKSSVVAERLGELLCKMFQPPLLVSLQPIQNRLPIRGMILDGLVVQESR